MRNTRSAALKTALLLVGLALTATVAAAQQQLSGANAVAQSPVKETLAYSRGIIRGTPPTSNGGASSQGPFRPSYYIYLVIKKGTSISLTGICVHNKSYTATLKKVESPVLVEHDQSVPTGEKDTLVRKTSDDVYQLEIGQKKGDCSDQRKSELEVRNEVVVCLKSGHSVWYGTVEKIKPLHPLSAM
jgi:uncharacterized protein YgiM (DUF1202 family)